mmetsp:Transcript_40752/g.95167  ORF Transcript_40752/g.95167 Transcript_40752/m.95167 type:complete len:241 (-) Transcript_40752:529-1251(-)
MIEDVLIAADVLHRGDPLRRGRVGEHHLAVEVANTPQAFNWLALCVQGAHLFVNLHEPSVHGYTQLLQTEALRKRHAAGANHDCINLDGRGRLLGLGVDHLDGARLLAGHSWNHLGREDADVRVDRARPDEHAVRKLRNLLVKSRHHFGHGFDKSDLGAESCVHIGKLETNVARTNDSNPVGHPLQLERFVGCEDGLAVDSHARRHEGHRARRENDILGRDGLVRADELYRRWPLHCAFL